MQPDITIEESGENTVLQEVNLYLHHDNDDDDDDDDDDEIKIAFAN